METLNHSLKYRQWHEQLASHGIVIRGEQTLSLVNKPNGELLFAFLKATNNTPEDQQIPPVVLLRGHFVSVLTILNAVDNGNQYLLMVEQRRIANGAFFLEHPAGMCDNDLDPIAVAAKELEEETGLIVPPAQIHLLNEEMLYSSPGLLDEGGYFCCTRLFLSQAEIDALNGKKCGSAHENEYIRLRVLTFAEATSLTRSANAMLNIFLYWQAIENGSL
jgi:ADP-sugar diphosphatase